MDLIPTKDKIPSRKQASPDSRASNNPSKADAKVTTSANSNVSQNTKEDDLLNFLNSNSAPTIHKQAINLPLAIIPIRSPK